MPNTHPADLDREALEKACEELSRYEGDNPDYLRALDDVLAAMPYETTPSSVVGEAEAGPCDNGCQYSKDIGMWPRHACSGECIYERDAAHPPVPAPSGEGRELTLAEQNRVLVNCCTDAAGNWCSTSKALDALHAGGFAIIRSKPSGGEE